MRSMTLAISAGADSGSRPTSKIRLATSWKTFIGSPARSSDFPWNVCHPFSRSQAPASSSRRLLPMPASPSIRTNAGFGRESKFVSALRSPSRPVRVRS